MSEHPFEFRVGAAVPVPVKNALSLSHICDMEFNLLELDEITSLVEGFRESHKNPAAWWANPPQMNPPQREVLSRLRNKVAETLDTFAWSIQLVDYVAEGIFIVRNVSVKILSVDLQTRRKPRPNGRTDIRLPCWLDMDALLIGWRLRNAFWTYIPKSKRWRLNFALKRTGDCALPAMVKVELGSVGTDVFGAPEPVERVVFATFWQDVWQLGATYEIGLFNFRAYIETGKVGLGFLLRIEIHDS
jgi:hypothetical protein